MPAKAAKKNAKGARQARGDHSRPPRDGLFRARRPGFELRAAEDGADDGGMPTLFGHLLRFDEWTEIDSLFEGHFMERIAPGATKKTIREQGDSMRCLFQHGMDPQVGDKPLGPFDELKEDGEGTYYEVPLLDTSYNRDLLPGLEAGLYGASFRFRVMREDFVEEPEPSEYNPRGLPERTVKEIEMREGGPVTFPAYAGATAGVRSLTDEFLMGRFAADRQRASRLLGFAGVRADAEDIGTLAQMLALAAEYIDEQDEDDEQPNIDTMQAVVVSLTGLLSGEAAEVEPADEPEDEDEANSADEPSGTEGRSEDEPDTASQEPEAEEATEEHDEPEKDDAGDRSTSTTGPTPLFPARGRKEPSWRL